MSKSVIPIDELKKTIPSFFSKKEIEDNKQEYLTAIKDCEEYLLEHPEAAAIAAPQLGLNLHLFVTHLKENKERKLKHFINTQLLIKQRPRYGNEGCMSCESYFFSIPRYELISAIFLRFNHKQELKDNTIQCTGFTARVLQHEIDHLIGLTVLDRAVPIEKPIVPHTPLYRFQSEESLDYKSEDSDIFLYKNNINLENSEKILIGVKYESRDTQGTGEKQDS